MPFSDKTLIVTGGAGALGRALVHHFAGQGARVAVLDYSDDVIKRAFPQCPADQLHLSCDLTRREDCQKAVDQVVGRWGQVDMLANIAGGFEMGEPVHNTSDKTWDFLFNLNSRSILNMSAAVIPLFLAQQSGKVVNVAAGPGLSGPPLMGAYAASKAAVMRLTESMAMELREHNINVNAIMPSMIDTPRNRADMPDADFSKWVRPEDIAKVVAFLCSDDAAVIHGATVPVNGLS